MKSDVKTYLYFLQRNRSLIARCGVRNASQIRTVSAGVPQGYSIVRSSLRNCFPYIDFLELMNRNGNADVAGRERQRDRKCHPKYLVVPNTKFIEQSAKCYSRLFSNGVYVRMLDRLSEEINKYYWDNLETKGDFSAKMAFMDDIERTIRRRKDWRFKLFPSGSTMTQLASKGSDLDVAFWCPDARQFFPSEADAAYHFLHWIRHFLKTDREIADDIDDLDYVEAKVPVLRIKSKAGVEVDLSACTESFVSGIHNSYLIRGFVSWDSRFASLCMLVKDWATRSEVKNPKLGGFNSYAMVLLVIHFLQCGVSPPILPNLQKLFPERYARNVDGMVRFPMALDFADVELSRDHLEVEPNPLNLAQLFILFLDYYSRFEFRTRYICMRDAEAKWRDGRDGSSPISDTYTVFIRDPMDDHSPGRTVRDVQDLQAKMKIALEMLTSPQKTVRLSDILSYM
ncbi:hypothetical protein Y032_0026g1316 [Ancylostoma ceylanicum]|uniref:Uncharacterized protein n=1 Tax=Ancylostoma ceylanicum TaxID=53326 RepID=A0A016UV65_9BILA|nr:hypothetical protein Y032_0026g1316 [Ancylostoma ceylanicum]